MNGQPVTFLHRGFGVDIRGTLDTAAGMVKFQGGQTLPPFGVLVLQNLELKQPVPVPVRSILQDLYDWGEPVQSAAAAAILQTLVGQK